MDEGKMPSELMKRLESIRPALEICGSVEPRDGGPRWRLRFRVDEGGVRRDRSISLPDEDTAMSVRARIFQWREEKKLRDAERAEREFLESIPEEDRWKYQMRGGIELVKAVEVAMAGPSRRQRRKARRRVDRAVERGPLSLIGLALTPPCFRLDRGGRPRTARNLW